MTGRGYHSALAKRRLLPEQHHQHVFLRTAFAVFWSKTRGPQASSRVQSCWLLYNRRRFQANRL